MKNLKIFKSLGALLFVGCVAAAVSQFSLAKDKPPVVKPFMPEVISQFPGVRDVAISPDEKEIYFTVQSYQGELSAIVCVKNIDGTYSKPEMAVFSGRFQDLEPFFSPDGLRLYFVSNRPLDAKTAEPKDYDIWYVERTAVNTAWSEPKNMGKPVNTTDNEFYPSVATSGNLYFTCDGAKSKGKDDIFFCKWKNGKYEAPVSMDDSINSVGYEFNAFVAPDESFIIYTCYNREGGLGSGDLYISEKSGDHWSASQNMGDAINSKQMDYCPFVNTKSGALYFTSKRNTVNTTFDDNQTLDELMKEMNRYENGLSRLYEVNIKSGWR